MKQFLKEINLSTAKERELVNITSKVQDIVTESGIKNGICVLWTTHATGAILVNEDEEGLKKDIILALEDIIPAKKDYYHNQIDDNAASHILSCFLSQGETLIIEKGEILRGTWQEIFFAELDGPRSTRKVLVKVIGD